MVAVSPSLIMNLISSSFFQVLMASRTAGAAASPSTLPLPDFALSIFPRQLMTHQANESLPTSGDSCQSTCEGLDHLQLDCPMTADAVKCVCTESGMDSVASCLNCELSLNNSRAAIDSSQAAMDKVVNNCREAGAPVTSRKLNDSTNGALGLAPGALVAMSALVTIACATIL
ncbi:hypothetical protein PTI98_012809 [Pleurotus ostreatus]|nr:hypothetical protein PTI98_012809 [Pleurotus ostreatus]